VLRIFVVILFAFDRLALKFSGLVPKLHLGTHLSAKLRFSLTPAKVGGASPPRIPSQARDRSPGHSRQCSGKSTFREHTRAVETKHSF
jgi:hypothetical protein